MFLAATIEKAIKDKFSYDNKCVWDKASQLDVKLPAAADGKPDFKFMELYMREILAEAEAKINALLD